MVTLRAYIVDLKYSLEDNLVVQLFCRTDEGKLLVIKDYYRPNFFIYPKKNIDLIQLRAKIARLKFDEKNQVTETKMVKKIINCQEDNFIQVFASRPETIGMIRNTVKEWDSIINYFEDDISLSRRYLLENNLIPFSVFEAEVIEHKDAGYFKLVKFINKDISFAEPHVIAISAAYEEDGAGKKAISAISCTSENFDKVITWKRTSQLSNVVQVNSEEELIITFKRIIQQQKPDVLLFEDWNFKLSDILERAKKYRIPMNINIDNSEPYVSPLNKRIRTVGINEIFIKRIIDNFINFALAEKSLDHAYQTISGIVNVATIVEDDSEENKIINMAHKKSKLNYMLFSSLYNNLTELFKLIGLRITDLLNFSLGTIIEWILIKQCISTNHIVLNKQKYEEENKIHNKKYQPVIDPVPGIYENIAVVDLTPIYPEIIIKNRLSPDTLLCTLSERKGLSEGILPMILGDILSRIERIEMALEKTQNENLQRRRNILSRICSYFYEYLNTPYARWFSYEILEQINTNAKIIINSIIKDTNEKNSIVFSDYNELYVELKEEQIEYIKKLKDKYPEASRIIIKDIYKRGFFLPREETKIVRKRFALLNDKGKVISNNIIRYTTPDFIKTSINEIMKSILINKPRTEIIELVRGKIKKLSDREVPSKDLIITTKLTRNLEEYNEKTIQHSIIKKLKEKGIIVKKGGFIKYIISKEEGPVSKRAKLPEELKEKEYDEEYYLERILLPSLEDILPLKGITPEDLTEPKDQAQLDKFIK